MEKDLVKRAHDAFNQGEYQDAIVRYQQAAYQYGQHIFDINIRICEKRLQKPGQVIKSAPKSAETTPIDQQLVETQELLEHYYRRCQELDYRLQDAG